MMLLALLLLVCYGCLTESQPPNPSIPIRTPPTILDSDSSCPVQPSSDIIEEELRKTKNIINSNIQLIRHCQCGGSGWTRVLYLNMADNGTSCPAKWKLHEKPVRGCGRKKTWAQSCDSVLIPVTMSYSIVCGRIHAYQRGRSSAFYISDYRNYNNPPSINNPYVSGLSLTHGLDRQRKHVWTFAGAYDGTTRYSYKSLPSTSCPCINPAHTWPYEVPSYVGDSYFCDYFYLV